MKVWDIVQLYKTESQSAFQDINNGLIIKFVNMIFDAYDNEKTLFAAGNGGNVASVQNLVVDLTGLDIGASVKISFVTLPENAEPTITDRDFVVATIAPPTIVKEPEKPAEEETTEGAEVEDVVAGEAAEAAPVKEGEAAKKDDKGKDKPADKKPAPDKKTPEKKEKK